MRSQIDYGSVRADYQARRIIDSHLSVYGRSYRHDYRPQPMPPLAPECRRSVGGVVRDGVIGSVIGGLLGGAIGGSDGADVGAAIGGIAGVTQPCD
ncbi:MAG: hypothetical protein AAB426_03465 [Myxococcota bacterium]